MQLTIYSRSRGRTFTFSRPGPDHIYLDTTGNHPGTLGQQPCEVGAFRGRTLTYAGSDEAEFARICRRWYRAYTRSLRYCL